MPWQQPRGEGTDPAPELPVGHPGVLLPACGRGRPLG